MIGIQIVGILFSLFMVYFCFLHYKRKEFSAIEFGYWTLLWVLFIYILFFPNNINIVLKYLNIARTMDFFMIVAFMVLFGLVFHNYTTAKRTMLKVEDLVRKNAFKDLKKKGKV